MPFHQRPICDLSPTPRDRVRTAVPLVEDSPAFNAALARFAEAFVSDDEEMQERAWDEAVAAGLAARAVYGPSQDDETA